MKTFFFFFFFGEHLRFVSLVLGLGLEHSCPWPRECLSSERLSLALASDFFCVLGLGLGLEPCVLDSTSVKNVIFSIFVSLYLFFVTKQRFLLRLINVTIFIKILCLSDVSNQRLFLFYRVSESAIIYRFVTSNIYLLLSDNYLLTIDLQTAIANIQKVKLNFKISKL